MIITRTPYRISFFGGGTDYPAWYLRHGGAVLSTAIDKYCHISCRHLPPFFQHKHRIVYSAIETVRHWSEIAHPAVRAVLALEEPAEGLEIHHDGDLPARSGLGSSSSFTVGLLNALAALNGRYRSRDELAREALHVEQKVIGENVGSQDQVAAAFGGFNRIDFHRSGEFDVAPVVLPPERRELFRRHLMLCFTGLSRFSSEVARSTIENISQRGRELDTMRGMVDDALAILQDRDRPLADFGHLMHEAWQLKRRLSDRVSNPDIDRLYGTARAAGAIGGKLMGAGGGGFMLLFTPPERQQAVREALPGLVHVPVGFDECGSRVVLYQPNGLH